MTKPRRARSMRGVMVDFDLIAIKEQMANRPAPLEVRARENFIDKRLRRRIKKPVEVSDISAKPVEDGIITPPMPAAEEDQGELIDTTPLIESEYDVTKKAIVRQRAKK